MTILKLFCKVHVLFNVPVTTTIRMDSVDSKAILRIKASGGRIRKKQINRLLQVHGTSFIRMGLVIGKHCSGVWGILVIPGSTDSQRSQVH